MIIKLPHIINCVYAHDAGLPLIYVGGLTVPLGFVRTKYYREDQDPDYGYKQAYVIFECVCCDARAILL